MKDQLLKFEPLANFGLLKGLYGSDLALEAQMIKEFEKTDCLFNSWNAL